MSRTVGRRYLTTLVHFLERALKRSGLSGPDIFWSITNERSTLTALTKSLTPKAFHPFSSTTDALVQMNATFDYGSYARIRYMISISHALSLIKISPIKRGFQENI